MIRIEDISINLCNLKLDITNLDKILNNCNQELKKTYDQKPDRVYLGFEYCDKMIDFFSIPELITVFNAVSSLNMKVTYVMPPMREENFEKHAEALNALISNTNVDEIVVNEFGMLNYLHTNLRESKPNILLGRLFDKAIREVRLNILEIEALKKNFGEISRSNLLDESYQNLLETLSINRIELDTFPDGVQDISNQNQLKVSIYYPKVYISRSSYCEAGSLGQKPENKFKLSNRCRFECSKIYKKIILEDNSRELIKRGNAILYNQPKPIHDIVDGSFRLVFSPVFQGY